MNQQRGGAAVQPTPIFLFGGVHLYGSACFFIFGLLYLFLVGSPYMFFSNCFFGAMCIANWLLYRKVGMEKWLATSFLVLVYVGLLNVVVHLGAQDSPLIYWGLSVAVAAAYIYGVAGTLAWVGVCLLFFPLSLYLKRVWFAYRVIPLDPRQIEILNFASYVGILLFLGYTFFLFQRKLVRTFGELARSEAAARRASRAKDVFLATLSHELRTPLTAIQTWSQLLKAGRLDEAQARHAAETIDKCARTQGRIINDLLDVSRMISGKLRLELQEADVVELVSESLEALETPLKQKGLSLNASFPSAPFAILLDPVRFKQIVTNLLSNAIKFSPDGGTVSLTVTELAGELRLTVADTGQGIEPELLERIFEPFIQADGSSVRSHGGLGLGLAIVRSLTELHGGTVTARSEGPGRGACFEVRLPADRALPRDPAPFSGEGPCMHTALQGARVLLVEDDAQSRNALQALLSGAGAAVAAVGSVAEALAQLEIFAPDLLVSDIAMPGEDGYSLIRKLRSSESGASRKLPAIALTAFGGTEEKQRILGAGFDLHLEKPVDSQALLASLVRLSRR
ncbi:MAG: ATP-binding protein [Oligoflexia bacterium]|nr:ATP-binding protein [Oligoflexia bacterium]